MNDLTDTKNENNIKNVVSTIEEMSFNDNIIKQKINDDDTGFIFKVLNILMKLRIIILNNLMLVLIIIAGGLGLGLGFALRKVNMDKQIIAYIGFPGELFVRALKFITMPLVFCNLITGMSFLKTSAKNIKNIGMQTFLFYSFSLSSSLLFGFLFVLTIKPGNRFSKELNITIFEPISTRKVSIHDTIMDIFRNLVPDNVVAITFQAYMSVLTPIYINVTKEANLSLINSVSNNSLAISINVSSTDISGYSVSNGTNYGTNYLGILAFCLIFGSIISDMGELGRNLHNFFDALSKAFFQILSIVVWFSPIGAFSLLCATILKLEHPQEVFQLLSIYVTTVLVGLIVQAVLVLPLAHFIATRSGVFKLLKNCSEALLVAFATSSSLVTLPVTFKCIEQKQKIPKFISRPILIVGTSIHFSGSPLYQLVGAIFIAQINGKEIEISQYFLTAFLTIISASTVAGIPSGGLVTSALILSGLDINQNQIGIIYPVDWIIDRFLTVTNVWGNCIATDIIYSLDKKLVQEDEIQN